MKFTLVPTLPLEIRWKIYGFAITKPKILAVHVKSSKIIPEKKRITFNFDIFFPSHNNLALLAVCKESRAEYLKICPASLPGPEDGNWMRYSPNDTIVYIQSFLWGFQDDKRIVKAIKKKWKMRWATEIKRLGVLNCCVGHLPMDYKKNAGTLGPRPLMDIFTSLEEWTIFDKEITSRDVPVFSRYRRPEAYEAFFGALEDSVTSIRGSLKQHRLYRKSTDSGPAILRKEIVFLQ